MDRHSRFLVCAHSSDAGLVIPVLRDAGCEADLACRKDGYSSKTFDQYRHSGLIILGNDGPSADNESVYGREMAWARAALAAGKAVLGICHGAQLLAHIRGGRLTHGRRLADKGLAPLNLTDSGENDPIVCQAKGSAVAQWHYDTFSVPDGAVDLAHSTNENSPHSDAFRLGRNAYGLQFHPELTTRLLVKDRWSRSRVPDEICAALEQTGLAVLRAWVEIALHSNSPCCP